MKKLVTAFLIASVLGGVLWSAVPPSSANWKESEIRRIEEENKRRLNQAKEQARSRSEAERKWAEERFRRARLEEERKRDLKRRLEYERKRELQRRLEEARKNKKK